MSVTQSQQLQMQAEVSGDGPPLLVVGGGLTGWASWRPMLPRLTEGRRVVLLQPLNVQFGLENRLLPTDYGVRTESEALNNAVEATGVELPADLLAWSYGAHAALDFTLNHPDRVRRLVLIEPPALWLLPDHGRAIPGVAEMEALIPDIAAEVSDYHLADFLRLAALVPPGGDPHGLPQWRDWVGYRRSLRNNPVLFTHVDDPARVAALDLPVLLFTGTGTSEFLRAVIEVLATTLRRVRVVELPGGHAPQLAAPDRFFEKVNAFLED
ncbi:Pimeloyl-ACP methyl ester carboxylesterase [Raineyella antarctica]|uniref:Pimeloyl-ACP methyl ester carboxylesterase n=1 Tax=Raineyella antarctica TaxID=1577474 RepID=A0A1G6GFD2_9ACTN|nr:alpha/beta hydrolase [Raineyella antarctica]SDB80455.1 Pimeloyl-ACP methyl ester carboxylesterase [Raineyella antarctica]